MLKKKIKILGFSVPVWALISLAVVGIAAAAFITAINARVNLTATGGVNVVFTDPVCTIHAGLGSIDECTLSDGELAITASGLDDDSVIKFNVNAANMDTVNAYHNATIPLAGDIDGVSEFSYNVPEDYELVAGNNVDMTLYIYLAELTPNQVIPEFYFQLAYTDVVP